MVLNTVTRETRFFLWLVVVFIGPYGLLLYLYPGGAGDYWAWEIAQPRTAMCVGAIYFASAFYYLLLLRQRQWHLLKNSLRSLFVVAAWLLLAAMFHWDAFFSYRILTLSWLGAYYLPLMAIPILFKLQAERVGDTADPAGRRVGAGWRAWLIVRGVIYLTAAILVFIFAEDVSSMWPWPIEPLNVRIFSGQIAVFGAFQGATLGDGLWLRGKMLMILTMMVALLQLFAMVVPGGGYDWSLLIGRLLPLMFVEWLATSSAMLWIYRK